MESSEFEHRYIVWSLKASSHGNVFQLHVQLLRLKLFIVLF